jgi:hypothetical protein
MGVAASQLDPQRWNRYAYAKSNPLRFVDSDGRWARDVHYDLTRALAYAAGFSAAAASAIAAADNGTDYGQTGYLRQPLDYHFTNPERRAELFETFEQAGSVTSFGRWLHATQDAFIHMDGFLGPLDHQLFRRDDTTWSFGPAVSTAQFTYATLTDQRVINTLNPALATQSVAVPYDLIAWHVRRYLREADKAKKATILSELFDIVDQYRKEHDQ